MVCAIRFIAIAKCFERSDSSPGGPLYERHIIMLWTIFLILLILWAIGMVTATTLNGFIHLLLVIAVVVLLIRIIQGRQPI